MRVLTFRSPTKSLANRIERPSLSFRMSGSCSGYPMLLAERPPIIKLIPPGKISLTADSLWGCRYCLLAASYVSLLTHTYTYSHLLTPTHTHTQGNANSILRSSRSLCSIASRAEKEGRLTY